MSGSARPSALWRHVAAVLACASGALAAHAAVAASGVARGSSQQDPSAGPAVLAAEAGADGMARDLREAVVRVPVQLQLQLQLQIQGQGQGQKADGPARPLGADLPVTLFRPAGPGPFPLAVISHGRDPQTRSRLQRPRFESAARFFVRKGFAVAVPLRVGYGELAALGDPEATSSCDRPRYRAAASAISEQLRAVVRQVSMLGDIDARRVVLVGQSLGGFGTLAATSDGIAGQVAAISFAGGHGADPRQHPGVPCQPEALLREFDRLGASPTAARVPTLWLHAQNDRYFAPRFVQDWADAYRRHGGQAELRLLPPFGEDGHDLFLAGNDHWQPLVDDFLRRLGFEQPGALPLPMAGRWRAGEERIFPFTSAALRDHYRDFLRTPFPRAFATNGFSRWGVASGDDAQSRALALCDGGEPSDEPCRLYAVNDALVWSSP